MTELEMLQIADIVVRNSGEGQRAAFQRLVEEKTGTHWAPDLWPRGVADALLEVAEAVTTRPRGARGWHEE